MTSPAASGFVHRSSKDFKVASRQLATNTGILGTQVTAQLDGLDREVSFDAGRMRHFDHGCAVTPHSSQGVTAERVLVNMDTRANPGLVNTLVAYVSISRASQQVLIFTNNTNSPGEALSRGANETAALSFRPEPGYGAETSTGYPATT